MKKQNDKKFETIHSVTDIEEYMRKLNPIGYIKSYNHSRCETLAEVLGNYEHKDTQYSYRGLANLYSRLMSNAVRNSMITASQRPSHSVPEYFVSYKRLRDQMPQRFTHKGKKLYWFDVLIEKFPFWQVITKGHHANGEGKLTRIQPYLHWYEPKDIVPVGPSSLRNTVAYATVNPAGVPKPVDPVDIVPIDVANLERFINQQNANYHSISDNEPNSEKRRNSIYDLIVRANNLMKQIHSGEVHTDPDTGVIQYQQDGLLYQYYDPATEKIWGRRTYKGFSLQNQPSSVREAALGSCFKYDIRTSVFAVYCELMKELGLDAKHIESTHICDYVRNSTAIRKHLAKTVILDTNTRIDNRADDLDFKIRKLIKPSITALGFGAKANHSRGFYNIKGYFQTTAVADIIYNNEDRQRFIDSDFVKGITAELKQLRQLVRHQQELFLTDVEPDRLPNNLYHSNGALNLNVLMAWLYQNCETVIMQKIYEMLQHKYGITPILTVHDGFYTKQLIDVAELNSEIRTQLGLKYIYIDAEQINPVTDYRVQENAEHHKRIAQEEQKAKNYVRKYDICSQTDNGIK